MEIKPQNPTGRLIVQRYGNGGFMIAGRMHQGSVLVFPDRVLSWPVGDPAALEPGDLGEIAGIELLLLGCGARAVAVSAGLRSWLRQQGTAVEAMDTGAACRTYNVLVMEGRRVGAALIAVG